MVFVALVYYHLLVKVVMKKTLLGMGRVCWCVFVEQFGLLNVMQFFAGLVHCSRH